MDLHTFPYIISWENLIKDQSILPVVIILSILITFSLDCVSKLLGENGCLSLLFLPDLVLQVDGAATTRSPLCVAKCALSSEEREKLATGRSDDESPGLGREERYYLKSSIKPLGGLTFFRPITGGGLIETGGLFERGDLFILPLFTPLPLSPSW